VLSDPTAVRVRELEAACDLGEQRAYELPLLDDEGPLEIDARPMIRAVVADVEARVEVGTIAGRFHNGLADATVLTPDRLPPNDGGIAYGRLAVAAARVTAGEGGADVRA
jgi:hypothetical protein